MPTSSFATIERMVARAKPEEQRRLLANLPRLLKLAPEDLGLLKIAQPSFDFWQNFDDEIYDYL